MALDLDYDAVLDDLREKMAQAFGLSSSAAILEAGGERIPIGQMELPAGLLRKANGPVTFERGTPLKCYRQTFSVECWVIRETTGGTYDLSELRSLLKAFAVAVNADPHLSDSATDSQLLEMEWDPEAGAWPVELESGEGLQAGYFTVQVIVEEVA